jgi:cell division protein FtsW (lipid II flippase)
MLFRVYRGADEGLAFGTAPTTAVKLAIELGWPAVWVALLVAVIICCLLLRGSLQRVRDSFYATAASGAAVLLMLEAFVDASLANDAVTTISAAVIGLGLVQTVSRLPQ